MGLVKYTSTTVHVLSMSIFRSSGLAIHTRLTSTDPQKAKGGHDKTCILLYALIANAQPAWDLKKILSSSVLCCSQSTSISMASLIRRNDMLMLMKF